MNEVYVVSATRTPIGSFLGNLSHLKAPQLGSIAIKAALAKAALSGTQVSEVIMGNVLQAGVGQAPARQAAIFSGLSESTPCATINKVCGSGLKAVMFGTQSIRLGDSQVVVAGGMESMSNTPYAITQMRNGNKLGNIPMTDLVVNDGLWDAYNNFHMGNAAEICAKEYKITREMQDAFAIQSYQKAIQATKDGIFKNEITPVEIKGKTESTWITEDEELSRVKLDKIPTLRPVFEKDGTITAANASSINDGASALVLASENAVKEFNLKPIAKIIAYSTHAQDPKWFTTAPTKAIEALLTKTGLTIDDIDLFEINEAFSVVSIVNNQLLKLDPAKVNIFGGAVAFGHPIGASGARILTTLITGLHHKKLNRGIASLCIGGGEAVSLLIERC